MLMTLFGISVIIFVLLRVVPGNIVDILFAAAGYVDPADKAHLEQELGLDQPIVVQYLHWIGGVLARGAAPIPRCPRSRGSARSCRGFRSPRGWPGSHYCSPRRSAFRSA